MGREERVHKLIAHSVELIMSRIKKTYMQKAVKLFTIIRLEDIKRPQGLVHILLGIDYAGYHHEKVMKKGSLFLLSSMFVMELFKWQNLKEKDSK